jgi:hypothetical protein
MEQNKFVTHGVYTVSNAGGYEVMLSNCNTMAKVRDAFGSDNPKTSDWLEIQWVESEDEPESYECIIDPQGYNIPLNLVIRMYSCNAGYMYTNKDGHQAHTWDFEESIGE